MTDRRLDDIERYYSAKIAEHGPVARGVDWKDEASQTLRFDKLSAAFTPDSTADVADWGCGYGAYCGYLSGRFPRMGYTGIDISAEMVEAARASLGETERRRFLQADRPDRPHDWCVASGIFNVRLERDDASWLGVIHDIIDLMDAHSTKGFAFNALTSYSDADKQRDYLYYASPEDLFARCKSRYSRFVTLLHDYDLYEFTIIVRKSP